MMSPLEIVQRAREATGIGQVPRHDEPARRAHGAKRVPFALLVGGLIVGSLALLLALNTASAANELRRHGLAAKNADVAARLQDLKVRVAASAAPDNLARAAGELGMVPAGNPAFVVIGPNGSATVLGKPKAATEAPVPVPKTSSPKPTSTPTTGAPVPPATSTGTARPGTTPTRPGTTATRPGTTPTRPGATRPVVPPTRPAAPPRPTSTPTPVVTLPGGAR